METILLGVTAGSLLIAFIMSAAAWRMSREERARSAARVAALTAASADAASATAIVTVPPAEELPLLPVLKTVEQPVATFAGVTTVPESTMPEGFLGSGEAREESGSRQRGLMLAAAALFLVLGGTGYWLISGDSSTSTNAAVSAPAAANSPLELISLRHERKGSRLSLSGLVRNPAAGAPVDALTAVVFLFDSNGGFISSARAGVDFKRLAAGDESPFVVTMNAPSSVARYRVSFRTDAGVVAHVDRRSEQPVATAIVR